MVLHVILRIQVTVSTIFKRPQRGVVGARHAGAEVGKLARGAGLRAQARVTQASGTIIRA